VTAELKSKCQKCSNELLLLENKISALNREIHDKSEEIGNIRQKYDQLSKDASTFESYLDSLQTDEQAVRTIVQKIQDAYQLTREELSKVTAQHKDTLKSLKMYSDYYNTQRLLMSELQSRILDLQSKLEKTSASNAEYQAKEGTYAEEKAGFQRHISRLESTIELLKQNQNFGNKVDSLINSMTQNTSSWLEKSTLISGELEKLRDIHLQRNISNETVQQKEIQDLVSLLQQREREYQHIFLDLGVSCPSKKSPSDPPRERERKILVEIPSIPSQKETANLASSSPPPTFHLKRSSGSSPRNKETIKYPRIQPPEPLQIGNDSKSVCATTKSAVTASSSSCPLCHEGPYGLMKICRKCGNQFHSACAKKVSNPNISRSSFQCSLCEK